MRGADTKPCFPGCRVPKPGDDETWLGRSLVAVSAAAVENFADRSARRLQRFFFPEDVLLQAEEELSMNTAMRELIDNGPLNRARRLLTQSDTGACTHPPHPALHRLSRQCRSQRHCCHTCVSHVRVTPSCPASCWIAVTCSQTSRNPVTVGQPHDMRRAPEHAECA